MTRFTDDVVRCRAGSLENVLCADGKYQKVRCRAGSLENNRLGGDCIYPSSLPRRQLRKLNAAGHAHVGMFAAAQAA